VAKQLVQKKRKTQFQKSSSKYLLAATLLIFLAVSLFTIFVVDRENWFDTSFSSETVYKLRTEGFSSINFAEWDVHPGTSYYLYTAWSYLNPNYLASPAQGISEYHWLQLMGVLFGLVFFYFAFKSMSHVFGRAGELGVMVLSFCSAYIHYFTEVRMYCITIALSAIIVYAIVKKLEGKWFWVAAVCLFIMPLTHYFASMAVFFYPVMAYFVLWKSGVDKKLALQKSALLFFIGFIAIVIALTQFAMPQKARTEGSWFQAPHIASWGSAVFYGFFMPESMAPNIFTTFIFVCMMAGFIGFAAYLIFRKAKGEGISDLMMMFAVLAACTPVVGLAGAPLLGGDGFAHLYHHRFFLIFTWFFAAVFLAQIMKYCMRKGVLKKALAVFTVVAAAFMLFMYMTSTHHELQNLIAKTPCENITILHESPFSVLPYMVYGREYNCPWNNMVSTNMTVRKLNGGGGDAIDDSKLKYNKWFPEEGDYYMVYAAGTIPMDGKDEVVLEEDGVTLLKIHRTGVHRAEDGWTYNLYVKGFTWQVNWTCNKEGGCNE